MTAGLDEQKGRMLGIALVTCSAAVFGLAGVLTKSIRADPLTINCWRGLVGALLITAYVFWRRSRDAAPRPLTLGWRGWLMAAVGAAASIAFIAAFKNTYVANVAIIYATAPFVAALLGWLLVRERVRSQTMLAAALSVAGVGLMVFSGIGTGRPFGDGLALLMTFGSALYMVLIRKFRDTPVVWAGAVSAFLLFGLGWFVTDPLAVSTRDAILLAAFGASFALASVLWTEGSRLIPAAEAGLLGSAEVPFAILFGWLFLAEFPPAASLVGGAIVLVAVFAHAARDLALARSGLAHSKKNASPRIKIDFSLEPSSPSPVVVYGRAVPMPKPPRPSFLLKPAARPAFSLGWVKPKLRQRLSSKFGSRPQSRHFQKLPLVCLVIAASRQPKVNKSRPRSCPTEEISFSDQRLVRFLKNLRLRFVPTPATSLILRPGSLLVGTGVHDRHPGKCGAGVDTRWVARVLFGPRSRLCARALSQNTGAGRWAGSDQGRKRRRRAHGSASTKLN